MKLVPCPLCGTHAPWENNPARPFCSAACKDKDLGNWATERYRIDTEEEPPPPPEQIPRKPED